MFLFYHAWYLYKITIDFSAIFHFYMWKHFYKLSLPTLPHYVRHTFTKVAHPYYFFFHKKYITYIYHNCSLLAKEKQVVTGPVCSALIRWASVWAPLVPAITTNCSSSTFENCSLDSAPHLHPVWSGPHFRHAFFVYGNSLSLTMLLDFLAWVNTLYGWAPTHTFPTQFMKFWME